MNLLTFLDCNRCYTHHFKFDDPASIYIFAVRVGLLKESFFTGMPQLIQQQCSLCLLGKIWHNLSM